MSYLVLAAIKILDNIILTAKSIATYKEQRLWSSILVTLSQLLFYLIISRVIEDNSIKSIVIISIASGIGNYLAFMINEQFRKESKWTIVITSSDMEDVMKLCSYLASNGIKYVANNGITRKGQETIHVIAFSKNKTESRLISNFIDNSDSKYLVEVI